MPPKLAIWDLVMESIRDGTQRVNTKKAIEENSYIIKIFLKQRQKLVQETFCRHYEQRRHFS